ncbi:DUF2523 domain-containing protein [Pseudomonas sp. Pseusp122]|jgi:hypothetical protein|uniref:DUF2523 domain-containing protein n=1 Tax=unclassified Pseudomonas TaxID=196821 RepID=UPI0039A77F98
MPQVIALLVSFFGEYIVSLGWKLLRGLGVGAVSYVGIQLVLDQAKQYAFSMLGSLPADWVGVLGLLKVDVCMNILFSAYVARAVLRGMDKSGNKSGFRWSGKQ